jgi:hypothetical protein
MAFPSDLTTAQDGETVVRYLGVYAEDDSEDEKGDRDCDDAVLNISSAGSPPPCRDDDRFHNPGGGAEAGPSSGPGPGSPGGANPPVGGNKVAVDIYVAFPVGKRSLANVVAIALTDYWNQTDDADYVMHGHNEAPPPITRRRRGRRVSGQERVLRRRLEEDLAEEEDAEEPFNLTAEVGEALANHSAANETANFTFWDMYYVAIYPSRLATPDTTVRWWWYRLKYACYWGDSVKPVRNQTVLSQVTADLTDSVATGQESGDFYAFMRQNYPYLAKTAINVTTVRPQESETDDLFDAPVDPRAWNWMRYTGLGVFCGTVAVAAALMLLAAYRHRRLYKHECWSNVNLGHEKGVEEILQMGWKLKGAQMEIYDKTKLGYSDDNSLFLGGFEQREPCGLGEITVTQPTDASESHTRVGL